MGVGIPAGSTERGLIIRCLRHLYTNQAFHSKALQSILSLPKQVHCDDQQTRCERAVYDERIHMPGGEVLTQRDSAGLGMSKALRDIPSHT